MIVEGWRPHDKLMGMSEKLISCAKTLQIWGRHRHGKLLSKQLKEKRCKLNELQLHTAWPYASTQVEALESEIAKLSTKRKSIGGNKAGLTGSDLETKIQNYFTHMPLCDSRRI